MSSMNRAAAIRKCLDKLDDLDEALFGAEVSIGSAQDLRDTLSKLFKRQIVPAPEEIDAIEWFFDMLEEKLNKDLKEEEGSEHEQFRNPRRRR